jgi:hypothetical protein
MSNADEQDEPRQPDEILPVSADALSPSETEELSHCEQIIDQGLRTFFEVGAALLRVRDHHLYRMEYPSFEAYCSERWGIERRQAYRLMDAAEVVEHMSNWTQTAPVNEAQARPLTKLKDPEQQREAWERVVQLAAGARITARLVEQVVDDLLTQTTMQFSSLADTDDDSDQEPAAHAATVDLNAHIDDEMSIDELNAALADLFDDEAPSTTTPHPPAEGWPDDLHAIDQILQAQGFELAQTTDTRRYYRRDNERLVVVQPPTPGQVRVRVVAHRADDWADVAERLARVGVALDSPRAGYLPKYPETRRAYGTLDLHAAPEDEEAGLRSVITRLRAELEQAQQPASTLPAQVLGILQEYQEHITRAQKFKPHSARGEAVSPLLRVIERIHLLLQESGDDCSSNTP